MSRAARVLHIVQPALTQQIQLLEEELGTQLLHRTPQGTLSTDAGETFYKHAQAILKQVGDAKSAVAQLSGNPTGSVALGMPQSVSGALALPLLRAVLETYPGISLQLTEELTGNLIEQLGSGRINLAILFDDGQLTAFASTRLLEEEMLFVSRTGSIFAPENASISLEDLIKLPLILPGLQHGVRSRIESIVRSNGMELKNVIEINPLTITKTALLADMGATILPIAPFLSDIERGGLSAHVITGAAVSRTVALCTSRNIPLTNATVAVKKLAEEVAANLCSSGSWPGTRALPRQ